MKTTKSKKKIELIERLHVLSVERKVLEAQEKELKNEIDELLGDDNVLSTGDLIALRSFRTTSRINKKKLSLILDEETLKEVTDVTEYSFIQIKKA